MLQNADWLSKIGAYIGFWKETRKLPDWGRTPPHRGIRPRRTSLWRARSRLNWSRCLRVTMRFAAFFKSYHFCALLHRSILKMLANMFPLSNLAQIDANNFANILSEFLIQFWLLYRACFLWWSPRAPNGRAKEIPQNSTVEKKFIEDTIWGTFIELLVSNIVWKRIIGTHFRSDFWNNFSWHVDFFRNDILQSGSSGSSLCRICYILLRGLFSFWASPAQFWRERCDEWSHWMHRMCLISPVTM